MCTKPLFDKDLAAAEVPELHRSRQVIPQNFAVYITFRSTAGTVALADEMGMYKTAIFW